MDLFHASQFKSSHHAKRQELIHLLSLKDSSKLVYQSHDSEKEALFDVLWVRSADDVWRMKFLSANPGSPVGQYVDHLTRNSAGFLENAESYPTLLLPQLKWHPSMAGNSFVPFENHSIKELISYEATPYEVPKIKTHLYYKLAIPLFSFLAPLVVAPFCIRFSRQNNPFFLYALSLFGLLVLYTLMDGTVILGEYSVISPFLAAFGPLLLVTLPFIYKFVKTT